MEKNSPGWKRAKASRATIHALCPKLEDGILRVSSQLSRSSMPAEAKHPIIRSKGLHSSTHLLRHVPLQVGHGERNYMLSKLREKYWITGASTAIRGVLSRCVACQRVNTRPMSQQMADLPSETVTPDELPFTRVGVDYFGPFKVRSRRSLVKRYGVIFNFPAIRAIHIKMASSHDLFINALRHLIARRGQVQELRSDTGTNLVGGERELKAAMEQWNQSQINDVLLQKGIKWSFNPPAGLHRRAAKPFPQPFGDYFSRLLWDGRHSCNDWTNAAEPQSTVKKCRQLNLTDHGAKLDN